MSINILNKREMKEINNRLHISEQFVINCNNRRFIASDTGIYEVETNEVETNVIKYKMDWCGMNKTEQIIRLSLM